MLSADQIDEPLEGVEAHDSDDVAAALRSVGDQKAALYVEDQADRIETLEAEVASKNAVLKELSGYECSCHPSFYKRGQVSPDCLAYLCGDDARTALGKDPVCRGIKAIRAALSPTTEQEG